MPNQLAHFAIEADEVDRARKFYESVFGWTFEPWGPPQFYLIHGAGTHGALQQRTQPSGAGGFRLSFAVSDLDVAARLVQKAGGRIHDDRYRIPTVGELLGFSDTEGNSAIIIQYEPERAAEMGLAGG